MPRSPCSFRETDVRRAIRATRSCGIEISRVEIDKTGTIVVVSGPQKEKVDEAGEVLNEWDDRQ